MRLVSQVVRALRFAASAVTPRWRFGIVLALTATFGAASLHKTAASENANSPGEQGAGRQPAAEATREPSPSGPSADAASADASGDWDGFVAVSDQEPTEAEVAIALEPIADVSEYEPAPNTAPADAGDRDVETPAAESPTFGAETTGAGQPVRPASFQGVIPRSSTRDDVLREWGMPLSGGASSPRLVYELSDFPVVELTLAGDRVETIQVTLAKPLATNHLIEALELGELRPSTSLTSADGGLATNFPERGVTLLHSSGSEMAQASDGGSAKPPADPQRVYGIEVRLPSAGDFVARAAQTSWYAFERRATDLSQAIALDPNHGEALLKFSELKLAQGEAATAEQFAARAVEAESPDRQGPCRLQWARCLTKLARLDEAVEQTRSVLESKGTTPIVRAQALQHMGALAAMGPKTTSQQAVPLATQAIELADSLASGAGDAADEVGTSLAAKRVLLDAHLAIAEEIAKGGYERKDEFVSQWLGRASAIAEDMIESGAADVSLRLDVALSALVAGSRLDPPITPELWVDEAEEAVQQLREQIDDEMATAAIDWQLGNIYRLAAEIQHRRGKADDALRYGDVATALMSPLADERNQLPETSYLIGRLYFQIGAVHAVYRNDHSEACRWYDRAVESLSTPYPVTVMSTPGQHGDALVSMGVSYWHAGQRERAYELTRNGAEKIQQAVAEGFLSKPALEVASDNLTAMGKVLGKSPTLDAPRSAPPQTQVAAVPTRSSAGSPTQRSAARPTNAGGTTQRSGVVRR